MNHLDRKRYQRKRMTPVAKGLATAEGYEPNKAIVRDADSAKAKALVEMGWMLVETKAMMANNAADLQAALAGAKTVVSTVSGNDMMPLEIAVAKAAKAAGATLFVPSQFGVDYRRWTVPFLAGKKVVIKAAKEAGFPVLTVFTGYFSDWIMSFFCDMENSKVTWIGDGNAKISWTYRSDIRYVLAKGLADPKLAKGGTLSMQGDFKSFNEATEILGKALGKSFISEYMDPQEAKKTEDDLLKKGLEGDVGSFYGSFKFHVMGEPARGNDGCNLSAEAVDYGYKMKNLEEVFKTAY